MRVLGLDVGDKTIGVAISDVSSTIAQGITTIRRKSFVEDVKAIEEIVKKYSVEKVVVGLPKNMNGSIGPQGEKVIKFGEKLREVLRIPVVFWDERLTTLQAERFLIEGVDMSRGKRKKVIDKLAATIILQSYLDSQKNS
ncbi:MULTISPECIES: Holliday junction resolvase RuvX [Caldanaerobacter]|uniref:Putative pre-16S rRNA nuclease n=3 Tax=Caldanaerobacter subterraneus TaxID=911092 RepID=YQGF_CALS4|nr:MULTISPECIES: Holliday junction resolvase RuvX [Caldanaerobacter]Q8R5S9.1 RecName: Full=Putative pre-16S rRNA nuclease [Caldanaerobacter subterraneus subsp. tengcongensis MB4]AAM24474.1 predicted endonuclease involved in recombination [Caldanaerobacter subterraneus subsp. tengcongensis MB4]ERM91652.1 Holliday junction resolvase [Caldanaerobacter subterraneus subsp. yonseiensis KB-1]MCS3915964.1 putative Holliday junction resolvase [Caldanaerobacter subterraneus subsp. tengcongensis MB4]MDI3